MPKFKDLGINAIPMTMQPPEIGAGGGGGYRVDTQCPDESTCGDTCVCSDDKVAYVDTQCPDENTCGDTCVCSDDKVDYMVATQCPDEGTCGDTCVPEEDKLRTSGFAPEAIAQLRQQLEERIDL